MASSTTGEKNAESINIETVAIELAPGNGERACAALSSRVRARKWEDYRPRHYALRICVLAEAVKRTNGLDFIVIDYDPLAIETGIDDSVSVISGASWSHPNGWLSDRIFAWSCDVNCDRFPRRWQKA